MKQTKSRRDTSADDPLIEQLAWLMDGCLRIGPWSIGLDGFLGLVPGLGDVAGGVVGAFIIARAMQNGVPRAAVLRMVVNVGIDSLVGSIPFAGDLFDFAFKANMKNVEIYKESLSGTREPIRDWGFIAVVALILAASIVLPVLGLFYLGRLVLAWKARPWLLKSVPACGGLHELGEGADQAVSSYHRVHPQVELPDRVEEMGDGRSTARSEAREEQIALK